MASLALITRFITTCSNCPGSISTSCGGVGEVELAAQVLANQPPDHRLHLVHGADQIDDPPLEHLLAAEGQQLLGQPGGALRRGADFAGIAVGFLVGRQPLDQEFGKAQDHRQQVVEVVGDAGGEAAHRFHALGMMQALLGRLERGVRAALHLAVGGFAQLALNRGPEPPQVLLEHVVVCTGAHRVDRGVLADGAGDDDERNVFGLLAEQAQRLGGAEALHRVIAEDDVEGARGERVEEVGAGFDGPGFGLEAMPAQLTSNQLHVVGGVLDEEHT